MVQCPICSEEVSVDNYGEHMRSQHKGSAQVSPKVVAAAIKRYQVRLLGETLGQRLWGIFDLHSGFFLEDPPGIKMSFVKKDDAERYANAMERLDNIPSNIPRQSAIPFGRSSAKEVKLAFTRAAKKTQGISSREERNILISREMLEPQIVRCPQCGEQVPVSKWGIHYRSHSQTE